MTGAVVGSSSVVLSGTVVCVLFGFSVSGGMFVAGCVVPILSHLALPYEVGHFKER